MDTALSLYYIPTALLLGTMHALEPGHAKTLTAAYLIGVRGTYRDALLLGLSVAITHSLVVIAIAAIALWLGRETFTDQATHWLQWVSGSTVILLGAWLLYRRWPSQAIQVHPESDDQPESHLAGQAEVHDHHDHDHRHLTDDEHARAHRGDLPDYVGRGERPSVYQILIFGAAGGLIPCPASVSVMLLALSVGAAGLGFLTVLAFSVGLALALIGIGLAVVSGATRLSRSSRLAPLMRHASLISAGMVLLSGCIALLMAH